MKPRQPLRWMGPALVVLALAPSPGARAQSPLERELALPALEELARWCQKQGLYGKRSDTYEVILSLDPEHRRARRGLKHTRRKGAWVAPAKPYCPKNKNAEALAAYPARRVELLAPYCRDVLRSIDEAGLRLTDGGAARALQRALTVSPDDPTLRALLGDVQVAGAWMMEESARASLHRLQLDAMRDDALARAAARVEDDHERAAEADLGVRWRAVATADHVRVLGTGTRSEVHRAAALQRAADDFLTGAFQLRKRAATSSTVLLLSPGQQHALLANVPGLSRSQREFFAGLSGVELPGDFRVLQWGRDQAHRLDAVTRLRVDHLLRDEFGLDDRDGWVFEGLGGYLSQRLTGTRLTWRVAGSAARADTAELGWSELFATPGADWLRLAHERLAVDGHLDLESATSRHVDDLTALDVLAAHALAAYLLEGRTELAQVLRDLGAGQSGPGALTRALALDLPALEWRLCRWLDQNVQPSAVAAADLAEPLLARLNAPDDPLLPSLLLGPGQASPTGR